MKIEDDGMGLRPASTAAPNECHGLKNVAARLRTLYGDHSSIKLEPREGGGATVTLRIPYGEAVNPA